MTQEEFENLKIGDTIYYLCTGVWGMVTKYTKVGQSKAFVKKLHDYTYIDENGEHNTSNMSIKFYPDYENETVDDLEDIMDDGGLIEASIQNVWLTYDEAKEELKKRLVEMN